MRILKAIPNKSLYEILCFGIIMVFVLQLLTDFVEAIYAFGLFGTGIPVEIVVIVSIFSPVILLFLPYGLSRLAVIALGELIIFSRALEAVLDTRGQLLVTAFGMACLMLFLPALLKNEAGIEQQKRGFTLTTGLAIGLALAICFRGLNSGLDITVDGNWQWLGWLLAVMAGVLLPGIIPNEHGNEIGHPAGIGKITLLSIGIISVFIVLFFTFTNPGIIARWTEASYVGIFAGIILALVISIFLFTNSKRFLAALTPPVILVLNAVFVLLLVLSILPHQVTFTQDLALYPLYEPAVSWLALLPVSLMIALFSVILLDFFLFSRELAAVQPSWRKLGVGFSLASLFLFFMIMAHVSTTGYDYIPVFGPLFRDRYWLVYLIAGSGLALPVLLVSKSSYDFRAGLNNYPKAASIPIFIALTGILTLAGVWRASAQAINGPSDDGMLRVFTYNVQQGYSGNDQRNYDGQIELIRSMDPDILGLQETDGLRIANGNADLVRYFADKLDMYSYYGPTPVTGTFGIALLSKYPIQNPRTFYMYSKGEQTAAIVAQISANDKTYNVYVTHLGNGGPIVQQDAILRDAQNKDNVIMMGDFNFRPDTEQYRLTTQSWQDAWLTRWPAGVENTNQPIENRIDHIFISPEMSVLDARFLTEPMSDHPALFADLR